MKMPIYRYFNGFIPNPLPCLTTYEFRPDVLGVAFEGIVETAGRSLTGDLGIESEGKTPLLSSSKTDRGQGSSALFKESPGFQDKSKQS